MIKKVTARYKNVEVIEAGSKMLHEIAHEQQIFNIFRGVKGGRTFDEEIRLQVATKFMAKEEFNEDLLFIYDITTEEDFRGSSIIKLLASKNKNLDSYLPKEIIDDIIEKQKNNEGGRI